MNVSINCRLYLYYMFLFSFLFSDTTMAYFVLLNERAIMCSCMYTFAMGSVCCHAIMASKMYQAMDVRPNYIHPRFLWNFKDDLIPRMMVYGFPRLYGAALDQEQQPPPAAGAHPAPVASSRPGATSVAASQKTPTYLPHMH